MEKTNQRRIEDLEKKLASFDQDKINKPSDHSGLKIASELVASLFIGVLFGNFCDKLFASRPIFMIICSLLAMIAAFRSIYRQSITKN